MDQQHQHRSWSENGSSTIPDTTAAPDGAQHPQQQQRYDPASDQLTLQTPLRDRSPSSHNPANTQPSNYQQGQQYEVYNNTPSLSTRAASMTISGGEAETHNSASMAYNADLEMEDANPINYEKYATRAPSSSNRNSQHYLPTQQPDGASRPVAYSPMNTSPTASYLSSPTQQFSATNPYTSYTPQQSARQSPTRQQYTSPPTQRYYASPTSSSRSNNAQLPPLQSNMSPGSESYYPQSATQQLNAVFGREATSPRMPAQQQTQAGGKGPVPQFSKVSDASNLEPRINAQPPFRRANPEGGFISPLQALTTHLPATYRICNPQFQYESSRNPRRVLTKPSKGVKNDGYDNEDSDYILYVNDILGSEETNHKNRYLILDVLGQGTFGQVVKCQNLKTQEVVAVKVVKNKTAYFNQSMMEVSVLDLLNGRMDKNDDHHILRLKDTFIHRQHLCLVFELLSVNLYELIKQNQFRGLSTTLVRVFAQQLLNGLCLLSKAKLIHCDLKPENILLKK